MRSSTIAIVAASVVAPAFVSAYPIVARTLESDVLVARSHHSKLAGDGLDLFTDGANAASTTENDRRSAKEYLKLAGDGLDFLANGANAAGAIKNDVQNSRRSKKDNWIKNVDSGLQVASQAANAIQAVAGAVGRRTQYWQEVGNGIGILDNEAKSEAMADSEHDRRSAKEYLKLAGDGLDFLADGANAVSTIESDVQNSRRASTVDADPLRWGTGIPEPFLDHFNLTGLEYDRRSASAKKYLKLVGNGLQFITNGANAAGAIKNDVQNSRRAATVNFDPLRWTTGIPEFLTDHFNSTGTSEYDRRSSSAKKYLKLAGDGLDFLANGANAAGAIKNDVQNSRRSKKDNWIKNVDSGLRVASQAANAIQAVAGAVGRREYMEELLARAILNDLD